MKIRLVSALIVLAETYAPKRDVSLILANNLIEDANAWGGRNRRDVGNPHLGVSRIC